MDSLLPPERSRARCSALAPHGPRRLSPSWAWSCRRGGVLSGTLWAMGVGIGSAHRSMGGAGSRSNLRRCGSGGWRPVGNKPCARETAGPINSSSSEGTVSRERMRLPAGLGPSEAIADAAHSLPPIRSALSGSGSSRRRNRRSGALVGGEPRKTQRSRRQRNRVARQQKTARTAGWIGGATLKETGCRRRADQRGERDGRSRGQGLA